MSMFRKLFGLSDSNGSATAILTRMMLWMKDVLFMAAGTKEFSPVEISSI
ncbi:hypothetical protein [Lederbergia citrea]|nr:hypothetical protein [Lederbergia citrea]MBS4178715.1 hypothetical protein [Lederbergia citrea]